MIKKDINQNGILNSELLNIIDYNYIFDEKPIKRIITKPVLENSKSRLEALKKKIETIENCNLKKNASKIVFADGNIESPIMIVGEGPGQKEDELGKPFVGDAGNLLNKMLKAINIERNKIYITNVVNYRPPNNRKPEQNEINRYSEFLKEHISIINPKILILMGSTAMEAILGSNKKISKERGQWKEIIIKQQNYKTIVTFHPAYLLRKPDQKKFSWEDLKIIHKEIDQQNISI
ncbi:MAG TPA: uracil-DNA glycosylase [Candidatus Pelagibacter bacterium]|jgi:DNA polymerase|nr:uracil-DNA glycosylase [Pelagibacteraceae bacterium]HJN84057.1 uracil-DNA glycosylase [Candidatus Pelagibacter bacterium]|tara:strand:+ start:942 stop:1646 length:705 start_codon:yes stop_codon:yes gene_type:complete